MARNARTTSGSNCVPAHRDSSFLASTTEDCRLYERAEVITSNTSATATIRPAREISSAASPCG
jgi:hypothetical protein